MSYPRSLDEIPTEELQAELDRRYRLRKAKRCDYCEQHYTDPPCRFPARHEAAKP